MGCNRTAEQIANWMYYTDEVREQIMDELFANDPANRH